ncbi:helix-turn-helix domain-containing protein [Chloroflexota bacterium]
MEWSERMNAAIDYIEDNLAGEIDISEAADKAYCSSFHFQKMFSAVIGVTPAEYIRQRRLTLAARELSSTDIRVIDVALKYGYNSPEAFTRAFRNLHGVTPTTARGMETKLTAYPRVSFHIELKGGNDMDYRIIEKPAFDILGISREYADGEISIEAPKFWAEWVVSEEYRKLLALTNWKFGPVTEAPIMSAYVDAKIGKGTWERVVNVMGIERTEKMDAQGFKTFHIPAATYAEFNCTLETSSETNKRIYSEWFPSTGYEHDSKPSIEAYFHVPLTSVIYVRWWVPVVKK